MSRHRTSPGSDCSPVNGRTRSSRHHKGIELDELDSESSDVSDSTSFNMSRTSVTSTEKSNTDISFSSPLSPNLHRPTSSSESLRSRVQNVDSHSYRNEDAHNEDCTPIKWDGRKSHQQSRNDLYPDLEELKKSTSKSPSFAKAKGKAVSTQKGNVVVECARLLYHSKVSKDADTNFALLIFVVITLLFFFLCLIWNWESSPKYVEKESEFKLFKKEIAELRTLFPNQNERLWKSVISSSKHILNETNSTYPSVIILASNSKAHSLSNCIAEKIASSFLKSRGHSNANRIPFTDIEHLQTYNVHDQKLMIDRAIQEALQSQNRKSYVIRNIQLLPPQAALIFHGLCDGDNAPFKDVMYILTLEVGNHIPTLTPNKAEDYLTDIWTSQLDYDKVAALMSRISNNVAILQTEFENLNEINKICQFII